MDARACLLDRRAQENHVTEMTPGIPLTAVTCRDDGHSIALGTIGECHFAGSLANVWASMRPPVMGMCLSRCNLEHDARDCASCCAHMRQAVVLSACFGSDVYWPEP